MDPVGISVDAYAGLLPDHNGSPLSAGLFKSCATGSEKERRNGCNEDRAHGFLREIHCLFGNGSGEAKSKIAGKKGINIWFIQGVVRKAAYPNLDILLPLVGVASSGRYFLFMGLSTIRRAAS
jgi:hypothetical protein